MKCLAITERDSRQPGEQRRPLIRRLERECAFGAVYVLPPGKRIPGDEQITVLKQDLVIPQSQVVPEIAPEAPVRGNVRTQEVNIQIISRHRRESLNRFVEMVEVKAVGRVDSVLKTGHDCKRTGKTMDK